MGFFSCLQQLAKLGKLVHGYFLYYLSSLFFKIKKQTKIRMKLKRAMYELIVTENVNQTL